MKKLRDYQPSKQNPFAVVGLDHKVVVPYKTANVAVNRETGELFELNPFIEQRTVITDLPKFTKVYHKSLTSVKEFSNSGLKVYCFILQKLRINEDEVYLYIDELKEFTGYKTKSNIYKGITELLDKEFLARASGSTEKYWINVNYMFNGKRQKLVK